MKKITRLWYSNLITSPIVLPLLPIQNFPLVKPMVEIAEPSKSQ